MASLIFAVRYLLPAGAVLAGLIFLGLGGRSSLAGGVSLIACGGVIFMINWFYRATVDEPEREREIEAREFYSRHGFWPDEKRER